MLLFGNGIAKNEILQLKGDLSALDLLILCPVSGLNYL